jgi:hypothetical protein
VALSRADKRALARRTTPTSRSRLLAQLRGRQPIIAPDDYFSPEIDIARRATERGFGDTTEDIGISRERGAFDFTRGKQDLERQRAEGLADIGTSRTRATEDYGQAIANLQRRYGQLGQQQSEQAGAQGVRHGGTLRASLKRRTENQALERRPIDTGQQRFLADLSTRQTRFGQGIDRSLGDLGLDYGRQFGEQGDVTRQERRVRRELPISMYDLDLQNIGAAVQSGFVPTGGVAPKPKRRPRHELRRRRR